MSRKVFYQGKNLEIIVIYIKLLEVLFVCFLGGDSPSNAQGLLLALHSEITPGGA